jgi:signal peptidase I
MRAARRHLLLVTALAAGMTLLAGSTKAIELFGYLCCYNIPSGSMKPTLQIGHIFGVAKYTSNDQPQRGDIVMFVLSKDPKTNYIKRLVGLAGDRVQMIDGALWLNGVAVKREQIEDYADVEDGKTSQVKRWRETLPNGISYETLDLVENGFLDNTPVYDVPAGHFFMLGDNRDNSTDSRVLQQFGYIPVANLIGRMKRP